MFVRGMIDYQIHHQADSAFMHSLQHPVKVFHGSEFLHDGLIIADIISVVVIRGLIYRGKPDHIHAELLQVIQL